MMFEIDHPRIALIIPNAVIAPTLKAINTRNIRGSNLPSVTVPACEAMEIIAGSAIEAANPKEKPNKANQKIDFFSKNSLDRLFPKGKIPISSPIRKNVAPIITIKRPKTIEMRLSGIV